uniref:CD209 antigen-like protein C n=2 Tax=Castor canadensis TaxID=51338 RepID=A0A8B7WJJ9_CASCN|nr:CD209 antigen-like protein C [Castor canadensis]
MSDSKEVREQQLGSLGYLTHGHIPLVLRLLILMLFLVLLVAILVKVSKISTSQEKEQLKQNEISQKLTQLKVGVDHLCQACPWDWTSFLGNCYLFSITQRNWHDSVNACQGVGAQLVVIKSDEEQRFLQNTSKNKGYSWMGLSDLKHEGIWHWVDGSPLSPSFTKYWNEGEPNNDWDEDCAEFRDEGWNDAPCKQEKFWICKKPAAACSME